MGTLPAGLRLAGFIMAYFEWIAMMFAPGFGEEVVVIAKK